MVGDGVLREGGVEPAGTGPAAVIQGDRPMGSTPRPGDHAAPRAHFVRLWTDHAEVTGLVEGDDRLSDALNARETLVVRDSVTHVAGSARLPERTPEIEVDPFAVSVAIGVRRPRVAAAARHAEGARWVHKVTYPVCLSGDGLTVTGRIHVFPGNEPEFVLSRLSSLFFAVTDATVRVRGCIVNDAWTDVVLVSRYAVDRLEPLDQAYFAAFPVGRAPALAAA
jgi:hypothetical protein